MAQNEKTKHSFTISEETSELLLQLRTVNQLFDCTFESIRKRVPTSKEDEDGTKGADEIFTKYFGEAQKVTRDAYLKAIADRIEDALLDCEATEI
jgi:hypothetical protein